MTKYRVISRRWAALGGFFFSQVLGAHAPERSVPELTPNALGDMQVQTLAARPAAWRHPQEPNAPKLGSLLSSPTQAPIKLNAGQAILEVLELAPLDLSRPEVISQLPFEGAPQEAHVVRVAIPLQPRLYPGTNIPQGLALLPMLLKTSLREFDLYYVHGRLLAIFPVLPSNTNLWKSIAAPRYFNVSPYDFEVPSVQDPKAAEKWDQHLARLDEDQAWIDRFHRTLPFRYSVFRRGDHSPFYFAEIDRQTGEVSVASLTEYQIRHHDHLFPHNDRYFQIIWPVLPTIPSPSAMSMVNHAYYQFIFERVRDLFQSGRLALQDARPYVVGPASGIDVLVQHLASGQTEFWASGINPFELANLRVLAAQAGLLVHTQVHDNILSPEGEVAFPGMPFTTVEWDLPSFHRQITEDGARPARLTDWHDKYFTLQDIRRCAEGMARVLSPRSASTGLLWSSWKPSVPPSPDWVKEALEKAGLEVPEALSYGPSAILPPINHMYRIAPSRHRVRIERVEAKDVELILPSLQAAAALEANTSVTREFFNLLYHELGGLPIQLFPRMIFMGYTPEGFLAGVHVLFEKRTVGGKAYLEGWYVVKSIFQRTGVATALVQDGMNWLIERGIPEYRATIRPTNRASFGVLVKAASAFGEVPELIEDGVNRYRVLLRAA